MSNVIKAYTVRYDEESKKTIDNQVRINQILSLLKPEAKAPAAVQEGFVEGLNTITVEPLPSQEEVKVINAQLTEDARNEAKRILEQAHMEAEQIKKDAYEAAQKQGYQDGMARAEKEIQVQKQELARQSEKLKQEYEDTVKALEPRIAEIIAALVEKITGIVVSDRDEVLYYLISRALLNMDKSNEYTIRVSKDDYEYIASRKDLLMGAVGRDIELYVTEDPSLEKNQCLIETELRVINCSLDVQLNNLQSDLKLLGGI